MKQKNGTPETGTTIKYSTVAAILVCAMTFSAYAADLRGRPAAQSCAFFLNSILSSITKGEEQIAYVGSLSELGSLMGQSGADAATVQETKKIIDFVFRKNSEPGNILVHTKEKLSKAEREESQLLICVLGGKCELAHGSALHMAVNTHFKITPFKTSEGESSKLGWLGVEGDRDKQPVPRTIVLNGGPRQISLQWSSNFIHEATHFADFELVSDWINANVKILMNQGLPDQLFTDYVRISKNGTEVDEGFMRVFLESRAYFAESLSFKPLAPPPMFTEINANLRKGALADMTSFRNVTSSVVTKFNVTEKNVFEIGIFFGKTMLASVEAANNLKPKT